MSQDFQARLSLSREQLDRDAIARQNPELLNELLAGEGTRILLIRKGRAAIAENALLFFAAADIAPTATTVYLGRDLEDQAPYVVAFVDDDDALAGAPQSLTDEQWEDLRVIGTSLSDRDSGLFTQALALYQWHASHLHSPKTGAPSVPATAGWVRKSTADNSEQFPRTDPAVIVLVTDDQDRVLLGNNAMWEKNRYSLLAGFVEPGESLEAAVIREVFEESGLRVEKPVYLGSQPWPFPASIMLGFEARLAPGQHPENHQADGEEILSLRWFTRDELKASLDDIMLPGRVSIARALIEHWLGEALDQDAGWTGRK